MFEGAGRLARVVALLIVAGTTLADSAASQSWRTLTSARQLWGTEPVNVRVEYGAGRLTVTPGDESMLYRMTLRYDEESVTPVSSYDESTRTLRLGISGRDRDRRSSHGEGSNATIALTREAPVDLKLDFGAGEAEIDLGGLRLHRLELSTGASQTAVRFDEPNPIRAERVEISAGAAELTVTGLGNARADEVNFQGGLGSTTLDFGGEWTGSATASVKMGIGAVVLRFPRELGVRIDRSSFLTGFDAPGMVRRDGSYFSSNWSSAAHQLTLSIDAALGSIEIEWID